MKRLQFTFYRSYYDAIRVLPKREQTAVLLALCAYALDKEEPNLTGTAGAIFTLIRPTLDSGWKKAIGGSRGTPQKDNEKIEERYGKDTAKEIEKENEIEDEKEKESSISPPPVPPSRGEPGKQEDGLSCLREPLRGKLQVWLDYKRERRESYKPTGLSALVSKVSVSAEKYGNQAVMDLIDQAMSCGYKGIPFDRLAQKNPGMIQQPEKREPGEFERRAIQRMMEWGAQHADE